MALTPRGGFPGLIACFMPSLAEVFSVLMSQIFQQKKVNLQNKFMG